MAVRAPWPSSFGSSFYVKRKEKKTFKAFPTIFRDLVDDQQKLFTYFRIPECGLHVFSNETESTIKTRTTTIEEVMGSGEHLFPESYETGKSISASFDSY